MAEDLKKTGAFLAFRWTDAAKFGGVKISMSNFGSKEREKVTKATFVLFIFMSRLEFHIERVCSVSMPASDFSSHSEEVFLPSQDSFPSFLGRIEQWRCNRKTKKWPVIDKSRYGWGYNGIFYEVIDLTELEKREKKYKRRQSSMTLAQRIHTLQWNFVITIEFIQH